MNIINRKSLLLSLVTFLVFSLFSPAASATTITSKQTIHGLEEAYFYSHNGSDSLANGTLITYKQQSYIPVREAARLLGLHLESASGNLYLTGGSSINLSNQLSTSLPKETVTDLSTVMRIGTSIGAQAGYVLEDDNPTPIYTKNAHQRLYPSSTVKIMTALLALEHGNLKELVTVGSAASNVPWDSSKAGIQPGDRLTLEQLLYAMMLPSGNDAAAAIAQHIAGSEQQFVQMMNARAKELGATSTSFTNAHGYHHANQYTTAADLALIAKEASRNSTFLKIAGASNYSASYRNKNGSTVTKSWKSTNQMVLPASSYYMSSIQAGKTGFTSHSRHNLVSFAHANGHDYVVVLLRGEREQRYRDTKNLLTAAYNKRAEVNQKQKAMTVLPYQGKVFIHSKDLTKQADLFVKDGRVYMSIASLSSLSSHLNNVQLSEKQAIKAGFNGELLSFDVEPIVQNGRMLVPMRTFFEAAGLSLHYDAQTKTIEGRSADTLIQMKVDSPVANVNGQVVTLDVPAHISQGRTLVPLRFISEATGSTVDWGRGRTLYLY